MEKAPNNPPNSEKIREKRGGDAEIVDFHVHVMPMLGRSSGKHSIHLQSMLRKRTGCSGQEL